MTDYNSPQDVLNSTDSSTKKLIGEILKIEKEFEYIQTISTATEKEISEKIVKLILQEIR